MKAKNNFLFVSIALAGLSFSAAGNNLLIGWDSGSGSSYFDVAAPGITGGVSTAQSRANLTDSNSQDGTFGSMFSGATVATTNPNVNVLAYAMGGRDIEGNRNNRLQFTINNDTGSSIELGFFHFDAMRRFSGAGTQISLFYGEGDLSVADGTLISTTPDGAIPLVADFGLGNEPRISTLWASFDISLSGLADNVLEDGQTATFWLQSSFGGDEFASMMVDNVAISIPEPGTYALLFGAGTLALVVFLRRKSVSQHTSP